MFCTPDMLTEFVWLGLNDLETEGVYTNFSDGTPADFENFPGNYIYARP